jgi:rfaE bifunctional protein nucleotidyltransferase chain/domain
MSSAKILKVARLTTLLGRLKKAGRRIVFTNGCFDILHYGHIRLLEKAKASGDILIVGMNSDASVKKIKGPSRPIRSQRERSAILAALESVDYVIVFDEPTPGRVIMALAPDVLVKGGDWHEGDIVGADFVRSRGGKVMTIPLERGYSTTGLVKKIRDGCCR